VADDSAKIHADEGGGSQKRSNGKILFSEKDPQGFQIRLELDTWHDHITLRHPEMRDKLDLVKMTIIEPEAIQQSPREPSTYYYYRLSGRKVFRRDDLFVIAVVHRDNGSQTGFIKTAHLVDSFRRGENFVWFKRA
jgi:hypothetical protein